MGRIVVHEFTTLDGVIDNPEWSMGYGYDPKMGSAIGRIMQSSKALLMGRNTYELFAPTWSTRTAADDPGAPFMNESPKYVVSSTLQDAADGLVDELHLFIFPLALGAGPRLFSDGLAGKFSLTDTESYDNGALYVVYQPVR